MCYCLCKKEFGSDTPKWVFHRGGGIHPPPGHPEISDAGSNRVNQVAVLGMFFKFILVFLALI